MFLASKIEWIGMVLTLLTTSMLVQGFPQSAATSDSNPAGVEAFVMKNEVKKMQQTLRDKGHFRGKVDGVFGLRTRDSIRAYQRAENLPMTGQVDIRTANGLGVRPEVNWDDSRPWVGQVRDRIGSQIETGKPSANIRWMNGAKRTSKTLPKPVKPVATPAASRRGDGLRTLQADNDSHPQ
jgi:peptidoglycan hydrolase-like protein with peptidoglycan-binding domain